MQILLIGLGGFLGTICRYLLSRGIDQWLPMRLIPYGTITVNTIGSFILAFMMASNLNRFQISQNVILFFGAGFLGAFTTFSTFTYESLSLFEHSLLRGFLYIGSTLILGYSAAFLGFVLGRGNL